MQVLRPRRLVPGDHVRVVAPSRSKALVDEHDNSALIENRFAEMGLTLSFGAHVQERDRWASSSIAARVEDLHDAFADPSVAAVLTVIGGFNSNELLPHLDWDLIRANPKVFCGFSDITALSMSMLARSGLSTYSGLHWSSFGMRDHGELAWTWFRAALLGDEPVVIEPSPTWTDDLWFLDQDDRHVETSVGWWTLHPGQARGPLVGGNLCTVNLLQGTDFMPSLTGAILAVEDDFTSDAPTFFRNLTSLLQLPGADEIVGLVIGRFQRDSAISRVDVEHAVAIQPALRDVPVLANVDIGHTMPTATLALGVDTQIDTERPSITQPPLPHTGAADR